MKMRSYWIAVLLAVMFWRPAEASNCSSLPYTLTNGQTADASQVMSNFNLLLNCANNALAHNGANSDITSLSALSTPLAAAEGGTGLISLVGAWTNANLAAMANGTIKGNVSGGSASPSDLTAAQVETLIQSKLPFEFYAFVGGLSGNGWTLARYTPSTPVILTTAASACSVGTSATGSTTYTLKDNGSAIGTAVISAGSTTCVATITSSPYTVAAGHVLSLSGPVTGDVTAADIGMTFGGTRN